MARKSETRGLDSKRLRPWLIASATGKPWLLSQADPSAQPFSSGDKASDKEEVRKIAGQIEDLQDMLFADRRFRVLVVLQGMDAAGKDGTVRGVFGEVSPLGVRTMSWKAPTPDERDHDFLWRIHQHVPASGELMIFNRSHYEDVLVPVVNAEISPETRIDRFRQINDFERLLVETGTVVLKFMLHISRDEQRTRLQARLDEPAKGWKFVPRDLEVRTQWSDYMKAYEALLGSTGTAIAPWIVVPSDSKTHRNLMIGTIVRDRLKLLGLRYPPRDPRFDGLKVS